VYQALYPNVFTGTQQATYNGISFTVGFDVQAPPQFNLSPGATGTALTEALSAAFAERVSAPAAIENADVISAVADALPTFTVTLPTVLLKLTNGVTTNLTLALTVQCAIQNNGNTISFVPLSVSAPQQSDPVTNYLVQNVVLPAIKNMMAQLLSGITIPPI